MTERAESLNADALTASDREALSRAVTALTLAVRDLASATPWPASEHALYRAQEAQEALQANEIWDWEQA